jgi:signal transduction histidine kinase
VLYGSASPSEAFETTTLQVEPIDLHEFLRHVAANAPCVGVENVLLQAEGVDRVMVRADEFPLEDVVTHVLRNADRHRRPGTPIILRLALREDVAELRIHNEGEPIDEALLDKIFEYGVSTAEADDGTGHEGRRGQGLFVAKTYLAKMGGTIEAVNEAGGVSFVLSLQRALL